MLPLIKRNFIKNYLIDFDPYKAGIRSGLSEDDARKKPLEWLQEQKVKDEIDAICELYKKEYQNNVLKTLKELDNIAHSDIKKLYNDDGTFKEIHELDDATAALIQSVEYRTDAEGVRFIKSVKFWDKIAALQVKAKHQKLLTDVSSGVNITIQAEDRDKPDNTGQSNG